MNKVFIVEDESALAEVLKDKFELENYEVRFVEDGGSAVKEIKKFEPDIVLLDLVLPNKNGFQILEELKADSELKDIPVIVLSSLDTDEDIKRALSMGAVDYFVKSNHPIKEVVEKTKNQLSKAR